MLTDIKNRGVTDTFFVVCDGLKGLPDVVGNVWPAAIVQTCIPHLIRNTFHLASKRDWDALKRDIRPIYTAPNEAAARGAFEDLVERWCTRYPAIVRLWDNAWQEFIPFLDYAAIGAVDSSAQHRRTTIAASKRVHQSSRRPGSAHSGPTSSMTVSLESPQLGHLGLTQTPEMINLLT